MTIPGPLQFQEERSPLMFSDEAFDWDMFFQKCNEYRSTHQFLEEEWLIVITESKNIENWFSAFSPEGERTIFIQATEWDSYIYAEPEYPIAYEVIANIFQSLLSKNIGEDLYNYAHNTPLGCMNDMCGWKPDISFKLRTGDICGDCLSILKEVCSNEVLSQGIMIFEILRKKMLFNAVLQKPLSFEEYLPFSIAITKRKLVTTLEPFRKMLMLIDHFDSIVRTGVLMLVNIAKSKNDVETFLTTRQLNKLPSLGNWVDALAVLANEHRHQFAEYQLPLDFAAKLQRVVQIANENKITWIRNEKRGHGYVDCQDGSYKELYMECLPAIEEIEKLLSTLFFRYRYFHIINLKRIEGRSFTITAHNLSGSNPAFVEQEIVTEFDSVEELPIEDRFYLVTPDLKKWYDLHPYFIYGECNLCHHNRLLVYDGIYMLDPYIGHRFLQQP